MKSRVGHRLAALGIAATLWSTASSQELRAPTNVALSESAIERKIASAEEQLRQLQAGLEATQQVKRRVVEAITRIDALSVPPQFDEEVARLRASVIARKAPSSQLVVGQANQLLFSFNQRLASVAPELQLGFSMRTPVASPSAREQLQNELFADLSFSDLFVQAQLPFTPQDQPLNEATRQQLQRLLDAIGTPAVTTKKAVLKSYFQKKLDEIGARETAKAAEIAALSEVITKLYEALDKAKKAQSRVDEGLMTWGIPFIAVAMILILAVPRVYSHDQGIQLQLFQSGMLVQIFTLFLLTATILVLGFANKIDSNSLGTLLGGISGYVLGRTTPKADGH